MLFRSGEGHGFGGGVPAHGVALGLGGGAQGHVRLKGLGPVGRIARVPAHQRQQLAEQGVGLLHQVVHIVGQVRIHILDCPGGISLGQLLQLSQLLADLSDIDLFLELPEVLNALAVQRAVGVRQAADPLEGPVSAFGIVALSGQAQGLGQLSGATQLDRKSVV